MKKVLRSTLIATVILGLLISGTSCIAPPIPAPSPTPTPAPAPARSPKPAPTPQIPTAPSNLTGEPISQSVINLQWSDNSDNEEGFRIYRGNNTVETVGANITTYQDTGLEPATPYQYAVQAYNDAGESETSTYTVTTLSPPINVRLDYFGIISNFAEDDWDGSTGEIQLVAVITDGKMTEEVYLPPDRTFF